jgi:hypothetical protein
VCDPLGSFAFSSSVYWWWISFLCLDCVEQGVEHQRKITTLSSPFQYKIVSSLGWRFFGWLHHNCLQSRLNVFWLVASQLFAVQVECFLVGCIVIQEKLNNLAEFWESDQEIHVVRLHCCEV